MGRTKMERNNKMSVKLEDAINILAGLFKGTGAKIIIVGGLSISAYGKNDRETYDIDAEISVRDKGAIERASDELNKKNIDNDISEDVSRWGMIDIPPDYRNRTKLFKKVDDVEFHLLSPVDLIISKLRSFRDVDISDSKYLVNKFNISIEEIRIAAEKAIETSPRSTDLFWFKKNIDIFEKELKIEMENKVQLDEPELKL